MEKRNGLENNGGMESIERGLSIDTSATQIKSTWTEIMAFTSSGPCIKSPWWSSYWYELSSYLYLLPFSRQYGIT